jgi:hypothetical protein
LDTFIYTWSHKPSPFNVVKYNAKVPYKHEPILDKIEYTAQQKSNGSHGVTLLFKSERQLHGFNTSLNAALVTLRTGSAHLPPIKFHNALNLYLIMFAIHRQMNQDLSDFLADVHSNARYMVCFRVAKTL